MNDSAESDNVSDTSSTSSRNSSSLFMFPPKTSEKTKSTGAHKFWSITKELYKRF